MSCCDRHEPPIKLEADQRRIERWIEEIDQYNATPGNGTTRQYLTDVEWEARMYLRGEMERIGLVVEMDCMGNLIGTLPGTEPELAPVWTGSHFDTVLHGGRFDGVAGVVAGMEALKLIADSGAAHRRNLACVAYAAEEPARFGIGCIGSRAMAGALSVQDLKTTRALDGPSLYDELRARELAADDIESCCKKPGDVFCAVELHIEQNSVLETSGVRLGVVKAICAALNFTVTVTGTAAHAGGMPMESRRDAFAAVSEMSLALERMTRENRMSEYCTGTIGFLQIEPNASNIIPGRVNFTVDIRDCDAASKNQLCDKVREEFAEIAARRGVALEMRLQNNDAPVSSHPALRTLLANCCEQRGISHCELISGPFHDSLFVGRFAPIGMLFVPSRDGLSHCPQEWTDCADMKVGAEVLADALLHTANLESLDQDGTDNHILRR